MGKSKALRAFFGVATVLLGVCAAGRAEASISFSAYVVEADPSYLEYSGSGFTAYGEVAIETYDPTTKAYVNTQNIYANAYGDISGYMYMNCADDDDLYAYAIDYTTYGFASVYPVRSGCIG
jgi:hypothetical protein